MSGLFVTLLIVSAFIQLRLPFLNIPITLQTFVILIIGCFFDVKQSLLITISYIFLGIIGLPVFANFSGGISYLVGPTGGFLMGFIPGVIFVSYVSNYFRKNKSLTQKKLFAIGIVFTLILYFCGVVFMYFSYFYTKNVSKGIKDILLLSVFPFVFGDILKVAAFSIVFPSVDRLRSGTK